MYDHSIDFGFKPLADEIISTKRDYAKSHGKTLRDMNMLTSEDIFDCKLCGQCCKGFGGTYVDERDIMANACPGMKKGLPPEDISRIAAMEKEKLDRDFNR